MRWRRASRTGRTWFSYTCKPISKARRPTPPRAIPRHLRALAGESESGKGERGKREKGGTGKEPDRRSRSSASLTTDGEVFHGEDKAGLGRNFPGGARRASQDGELFLRPPREHLPRAACWFHRGGALSGTKPAARVPRGPRVIHRLPWRTAKLSAAVFLSVSGSPFLPFPPFSFSGFPAEMRELTVRAVLAHRAGRLLRSSHTSLDGLIASTAVFV